MKWPLCGCFDPTTEFALPEHKFLRLLGHGNEGEVWLVKDKAGKLSGARHTHPCADWTRQ